MYIIIIEGKIHLQLHSVYLDFDKRQQPKHCKVADNPPHTPARVASINRFPSSHCHNTKKLLIRIIPGRPLTGNVYVCGTKMDVIEVWRYCRCPHCQLLGSARDKMTYIALPWSKPTLITRES